MTPICEMRSKNGTCRLPFGHTGEHCTRHGYHFTTEESHEYLKANPDIVREQP